VIPVTWYTGQLQGMVRRKGTLEFLSFPTRRSPRFVKEGQGSEVEKF
jgi:hypothetical protein